MVENVRAEALTVTAAGATEATTPVAVGVLKKTAPEHRSDLGLASATTLIEIESIQLPEGTNGDAGTRAGVASLALARPKSLLCSGAVFFKTPTATGVVASVAPAAVTVSASARTFSTI